MNPHAFALAARGFRVFELAPGAKYPSASGWQDRATDDPIAASEIIPPGANVGICTDGYIVLDIDAGKGGLEALELLKAFGVLPRTFVVRSARGGLHIYFKPRNGERFRSRAHRIIKGEKSLTETFALAGFQGIDIRADGGLTVGPGSTFEGKPYEIVDDSEIAELPEFVAEFARAAAPKLATVSGLPSNLELDQPDAILRATNYLLSAAPAIEGEAGDPHTITVANKVMDYGISPDTAAELMHDHWDARCLPPWGLEDLQRKCRSAAKSRQDPIGRNLRDDVFSAVEYVDLRSPAPEAPRLGSLLRWPSQISLDTIIARQDRGLIHGILAPRDLAVLYGASGSGKTFIALEMAYCVALGKPWHGRRVNRACVLYCSLEGLDGFEKRILAAEDKYGKTEWFAYLGIPVALTRSDTGAKGAADVIRAANELKAKTGATDCLIVFDTLARVMAGDDENSTEAMGYFVEQRAAVIIRETGASSVYVHHTGKSGDMRGSTVLKGAADCVLRAERNDKARTLYAEKVKDDADGLALFNYRLTQIRLGVDSHGAAVTSCIVEAGISERVRLAKSLAIELIEAALKADPELKLSPAANSVNWAGRWLEERRPEHCDYSAEEFAAAVDELLIDRLDVVEYSNKGRPAKKYALKPKIVSGADVFTD